MEVTGRKQLCKVVTCVLCLTFLTKLPAAEPLTPAWAMRLAANDIQKMPSPETIRYLTLYPIQEKDLEDWVIMINTQPNMLSREPRLRKPYLIPNSEGRLFRIDLADYRIDPNVWEKLANSEPYFHYRAVVGTIKSVRKPAGKKSKRSLTTSKRKIVREQGTWVTENTQDLALLRKLVRLTNSQIPIVRGDWFFYRTAIQAGRNNNNPGYYQFLGVKNQKDYEKLIGFNRDQSNDFTRPLLESVEHSGVSIQPRRISREEKVGGGYWRTFDNKLAIGVRNPLRVLNGGFKFDATEAFGHLSNGLWAMSLFDNNGVLQDSAPDFVGHDKTTTNNDGRIHVPLGCIRCHSNGGLNDFKPHFRDLFRQPLALASPDPVKLRVLESQYLIPLEPYFEDDRRRYSRALFEISGLESKAFASRYGRAWFKIAERSVTLDVAARELGTTEEKFIAALSKTMQANAEVDLALATYLLPKDRRKGLPRDQWEEVYPEAQFILRGAYPKDYARLFSEKLKLKVEIK